MKRFFLLILNLIIIFAMSCEGTEYFPKCSECSADEPYEAMLKCKIDWDNKQGTLVQIWEGKLEDSILIDSRRVYSSASFEKKVPLNRYYTVTATYIIDNKTYVAVGSASPKVKHTNSQCDEPCYFVYNNIVNLQLKYTK
jgi:hypothetical protein